MKFFCKAAMKTPTSRYMPQMDSLRGLAVTAVLVQHSFGNRVPIGTWAVALFFVISGYLISRSIFSLRDAGMRLPQAALHFFTRRTLRLFPAYYLTVILGALLFEKMRPDWLWYAGYATNFLIDFRQTLVPLTPTWSLAIEEQFYVGWFLLLMLMASKKLGALTIFLIVLAPVARYILIAGGDPFGTYLPWTNCDALAVGALLCLRERKGIDKAFLSARITVFLLLASVFCALTALKWDPLFGPFGALVSLAISLASAFLVSMARHGFAGTLGGFLEWRPLVYIGKISYGIYLYDMLTSEIARLLFSSTPFFWRLAAEGTAIGFVSHCAITVAFAAMSFRFFEMPLRRLFDHRTRSVAAAGS